MRSLLRILFVLLLCSSLTIAGWFVYYVFKPLPGQGEVLVVLPKGAGSRQIMALLGAKGVIKDDIRFLALVQLLREIERDHPPKLRAGEFNVPLGLTPLQVIRFLHNAKPVQYRVTIPEGLTMIQIADIFAKKGWADRAKFLQLCQDKKFLQKLGVQADSLEGYLFPETYSLVRGETDEQILITSMVQRFFAVWKELNATKLSAQEVKYSPQQLLILASIVEKETGAASERKIIAGVFYNRLSIGMRLQSDPTTIYGLKNFNGNLTKADLLAETPYNTYVISGLPLGPICNPGQAALEAVLRPADVPYFYFVANKDGSHIFSRTLEEHNRAVAIYQKRKD